MAIGEVVMVGKDGAVMYCRRRNRPEASVFQISGIMEIGWGKMESDLNFELSWLCGFLHFVAKVWNPWGYGPQVCLYTQFRSQ